MHPRRDVGEQDIVLTLHIDEYHHLHKYGGKLSRLDGPFMVTWCVLVRTMYIGSRSHLSDESSFSLFILVYYGDFLEFGLFLFAIAEYVFLGVLPIN